MLFSSNQNLFHPVAIAPGFFLAINIKLENQLFIAHVLSNSLFIIYYFLFFKSGTLQSSMKIK